MGVLIGGGNLTLGSRNVVRTSTGILYAGVYDETAATHYIEIWKSTDNGVTWTEQDTSNKPSSADYKGMAITIGDDNIIQIIYMDDGATKRALHTFFNTADAASFQDTFRGVYTIKTGIGKTGYVAITVDKNNVPHVAYTYLVTTRAGTFETLWYANAVGGTWNASREVEGATASKAVITPDICMNGSATDGRPHITYFNQTDSDIGTAIGNGNNATAFTLFDIEANGLPTPSICSDLSDSIFVSYVNTSGDLLTRKHLSADAWTTWQTAVTLDSTNNYEATSIAYSPMDNRYPNNYHVLSSDTGDSDIYYFEDTMTRISAEVGTVTFPKGKWQFYFDNFGWNKLDFCYQNGADVYYSYVNIRRIRDPILTGGIVPTARR